MAKVTVQLRVEDELLAQIDAAARARFQSRTAFLLDAARVNLGSSTATPVPMPPMSDEVEAVVEPYAKPSTESCRHPVSRRIGNQCAACGQTAGAKR